MACKRLLLLGLLPFAFALGCSAAESSDDEDATAPVAALAKQLGFAPVELGKLNEGGALVHARGRTLGQLIFQDLFKKEQ